MDLFASSAIDRANEFLAEIDALPLNEKIEAINQLRRAIHAISPFKNEPVDCVEWVSADSVQANDYNPNSVAPPEMRLLEHSIAEDGYTQPKSAAYERYMEMRSAGKEREAA